MGDEDIIRRRLMIDGDGTGDARVMTMFMKSFIKWCSADDTPEDSQNSMDKLFTQLGSVDHSSMKWRTIVDMNKEEIQSYHNLREETSVNVEDACLALDGAKKNLEDARQVRRNRLEYDALARLIKEHPPRSDTANKLAELRQELSSLKSNRDHLEENLGLRRKQLHVLVTALHQLQATLTDSDTQDNGNDQERLDIVDLTQDPGIDIAMET